MDVKMDEIKRLDLDLNELCDIIHNPERQDELDSLLQQCDEVEDEGGDKSEILYLRDANIAKELIIPVKHKYIKIRDVRNIPIYDDDVMVCSYPKTGSHWLSNMVHLLHQKDELDKATPHSLLMIDLFEPDAIARASRPRVLCSHRRPHQLPKALHEKKTKLLLLYRNPKDTCVSEYHHVYKLGFKRSWEFYYRAWLKGLLPLDDYFEYYNTWQTAIETDPNLQVLLVKYEDLKRNCVAELSRIQDFLGFHHSSEHLQAIVDKCSMSNLKHNVESGKLSGQAGEEISNDGVSIIYRKGIVGDWKNQFTVSQNEQADAVIKHKLRPDTMLQLDFI